MISVSCHSRRAKFGTLTSVLVAAPAIFLGAVLLFGLQDARAQGSPVRTCLHPDDPPLNFGQAATACDAAPFGDVNRIKYIYPDYVFDRRASDIDAERKRYTTNMNALIKNVCSKFYTKHFPNASTADVSAWCHAIMAVATNETYISHYRIGPDARYKLMTGDHVKSHGMMQNNQEYSNNHFIDSSFDLVGNLQTGMDHFYYEYMNAAGSRCYARLKAKKGVSSSALAQARFQGAYSAYNGGSGSVCRYTNHRSRWHANDDHYLQAYRNQDWIPLITNPSKKVKLNTSCLMEGDDLCAIAEPYVGQFLAKHPIVLDNGLTCLSNDGVNFQCADEPRIFACMTDYDLSHVNARPIKMHRVTAQMNFKVIYDRDPLCTAKVPGIATAGDTIKVLKRITIRPHSGGGTGSTRLGTVEAGSTYQVVDYDVAIGKTAPRFYKIQLHSGKYGWISGGTNADASKWVVKVQDGEHVAKTHRDYTMPTASTVDDSQAAGATTDGDPSAAPSVDSTTADAPNGSDDDGGDDLNPWDRGVDETPIPPGVADAISALDAMNPPPPPPVPPASIANSSATSPQNLPMPTDAIAPGLTVPTTSQDTAVTTSTTTATSAASPSPSPTPVAKKKSHSYSDDEEEDTQTAAPTIVIPNKGSVVEITIDTGIKLRDKADKDGAELATIPTGTQLTVLAMKKSFWSNKIWLQVTYGGTTGFIYVGSTYPQPSISDWIKIIPAPQQAQQ